MSRRSRLSSVCVDCTRDCSYEAHASLVLGVAYLGNLKLLQHCSCLCGNYLHIRDSLGRTALHVAASKGHLQLVQWLLDNKVQLHTSDLESRWTALHRSVYYGQLGTAALLVKVWGDGITSVLYPCRLEETFVRGTMTTLHHSPFSIWTGRPSVAL